MILRGIPLQNITKPPFGVTSAVWSLFPTTGPKGTKLSPRVIKDPSRDETTFSTSSVLTKMPTSLPCKGAKKSGMNSKQDMEIVTGWHVNSIHLTHWNSGSPICPICLQVHSLQSSSPKVTIRFNYFILPLDSLCFYLKESFHVSVKFFSIQKDPKGMKWQHPSWSGMRIFGLIGPPTEKFREELRILKGNQRNQHENCVCDSPQTSLALPYLRSQKNIQLQKLNQRLNHQRFSEHFKDEQYYNLTI